MADCKRREGRSVIQPDCCELCQRMKNTVRVPMTGAAEQVNSLGGEANMQNMPHYRVWGHGAPGKFSNLQALRMNMEPSGGT